MARNPPPPRVQMDYPTKTVLRLVCHRCGMDHGEVSPDEKMNQLCKGCNAQLFLKKSIVSTKPNIAPPPQYQPSPPPPPKNAARRKGTH